MPSASPRSSPLSASTPSSTRSLLSRIKTPFASKQRNIFEFDIQPDDPHRQYASGDVVSGTVILKVVKPVRITHLVISLHGFVQVYKNPSAAASESWRTNQSTVGTGKGSRSGGYHGNGFASLFEDESVLCGEGRLTEGIYHFNFELMFPQKQLPSSIDFERGTVTYMLTATLTRPTTISPISTCDRKINLIESIDVAPLFEPKPRIISLEPKPARSRVKGTRKRPPAQAPAPEAKPSETAETSDQTRGRTSELSSVDENDMPNSPTPSDVSFETQISGTTGSMEEAAQASARAGELGNPKLVIGTAGPANKKAITASIELQKAGFLRGDQIPLKITVNHTKYIKSLHGIIVTLYRRATVDMHPALPVVGRSEKKPEDYMPRSKSGLGGLSLSSSGSSHTFRKDLAQSFAPLIIDPRTLTAEVKVSVRVPDEAFPTISSVPGAMISFKYFVEVLVDLQGKLAGLGRYLPNSGVLSMSAGYGSNPAAASRAEEGAGTMVAAWGSNFLETSQIRRDKSVVACLFEVIVGTKDSERKNKIKGKARDEEGLPETNGESSDSGLQNTAILTEEYSAQYGYGMYPPPTEPAQQHEPYYGYDEFADSQAHPPAFPAPSRLEAEEAGLSEKERLRRAEARLLPSAPPVVDGGSESSAAVAGSHAPSAPMLPGDERGLLAQSPTAPPPLSPFLPSDDDDDDEIGMPRPPAAPLGAFLDAYPRASVPPAPAYESHASSSETRIDTGPAPQSSKEDVQRRHLEMQRSAPPPELDDDDGDGDGGAQLANHHHHHRRHHHHVHAATAPSAPMLGVEIDMDDNIRTRIGRGEGGSPYSLPRYER